MRCGLLEHPRTAGTVGTKEKARLLKAPIQIAKDPSKAFDCNEFNIGKRGPYEF